ncbi:MAG: AAA family ATPase [Candidatus Njordarchaeia archaeon]
MNSLNPKFGSIKAILITGMPGSGKGTVTKVAKGLGIPVIVMGELVFEETKKRGYELTPSNIAMVAKSLRAERGDGAVATLVLDKIKEHIEGKFNLSKIIVVEGLRSKSEYEIFQKSFGNVILVAILASQEVRYSRIIMRNRVDQEKDINALARRDMRELAFGIGELVTIADYYIFNENSPIEVFEKEAKEVLINLLKDD